MYFWTLECKIYAIMKEPKLHSPWTHRHSQPPFFLFLIPQSLFFSIYPPHLCQEISTFIVSHSYSFHPNSLSILLFLPSLAYISPARPSVPHWGGKALSLSSLFGTELILTSGSSPADERLGSVASQCFQSSALFHPPLLHVTMWEITCCLRNADQE